MPTRRNLVQIEIRCKEHESFTHDCKACLFVDRFERRFDDLRERRGRFVHELRERLRRGDVVLMDLR